MKHSTKKESWKSYLQLICRANLPWLLLIGYFLIGLVYSRISTDIVPFASKIYTGEILDSSAIGQYILLVAVMLGTWFLQAIFQYWTSFRMDRQFQLATWKSMVHMPMSALGQQNAAAFPSRITSDATKLSTQFLQLTVVLTSVYTIWITLSNVHKDSAFMASFMLKMLALLFIWIVVSSFPCGRFKFKAAFRFQETYAAFTDYITERLSGISLIKSSAAEESEITRAMQEIDNQYRAELYQVNVQYITTLVSQCSVYIFQALVLFTGAMMVREGTLDQAGMLTAYRYSMILPIYLLNIMNTYLAIKDGQGCAARVSEIVATKPETYRRKKSFSMEDADITFKDVTFRYGEKRGLNDVSFTIPAGRVTALMGLNGSGKSTVVNLIERFYLPETGDIRFGTCPVEDIHLDEWRKSIGYIAQNTTLISGTLRENLVYALHRSVTDEELRQALRSANLEQFLNGLSNGLDTDLGELGLHLSGGERQRIGIARVILQNPEYVIMDEVTSALDPENEALVMSSLRKLMRGRTSVVISHNMDVIRRADHIVLLDEGIVQGEGTHESLMHDCSLYATLCEAAC